MAWTAERAKYEFKLTLIIGWLVNNTNDAPADLTPTDLTFRQFIDRDTVAFINPEKTSWELSGKSSFKQSYKYTAPDLNTTILSRLAFFTEQKISLADNRRIIATITNTRDDAATTSKGLKQQLETAKKVIDNLRDQISISCLMATAVGALSVDQSMQIAVHSFMQDEKTLLPAEFVATVFLQAPRTIAHLAKNYLKPKQQTLDKSDAIMRLKVLAPRLRRKFPMQGENISDFEQIILSEFPNQQSPNNTKQQEAAGN